MSAASFRELMEALAINTRLHDLELSYMEAHLHLISPRPMSEADAEAIGDMLRQNATLRQLWLEDHAFTPATVTLLADAMHSNHTLTDMRCRPNLVPQEAKQSMQFIQHRCFQNEMLAREMEERATAPSEDSSASLLLARVQQNDATLKEVPPGEGPEDLIYEPQFRMWALAVPIMRALHHNTQVTRLYLHSESNAFASVSAVQELAEMLSHNRSITDLDIFNSIPVLHIPLVASGLRLHPMLRSFSFCVGEAEDVAGEGLQSLVAALPHCPSLERLTLGAQFRRCSDACGFGMAQLVRQGTLKSLILPDIRLQGAPLRTLMDALASSTSITRVDLRALSLTYDAVVDIGSMLRQNESLERFVLAPLGELTSASATMLAASLRCHPSLTFLHVEMEKVPPRSAEAYQHELHRLLHENKHDPAAAKARAAAARAHWSTSPIVADVPASSTAAAGAASHSSSSPSPLSGGTAPTFSALPAAAFIGEGQDGAAAIATVEAAAEPGSNADLLEEYKAEEGRPEQMQQQQWQASHLAAEGGNSSYAALAPSPAFSSSAASAAAVSSAAAPPGGAPVFAATAAARRWGPAVFCPVCGNLFGEAAHFQFCPNCGQPRPQL